jgi:hypothetical protein
MKEREGTEEVQEEEKWGHICWQTHKEGRTHLVHDPETPQKKRKKIKKRPPLPTHLWDLKKKNKKKKVK